MSYSAHRPQGYEGQGDLHLGRIVRQLRRTLAEAQRDFSHDTLRLDAYALGELAAILVDFGEDIHSRGGIWEAYERCNKEFFGTALPLTLEPSDGGAGTGFGPDRFRHFLWVHDAFHDSHRRADEERQSLDQGRGGGDSRVLRFAGDQPKVRQASAGGIRRRVGEGGISAEGRPAGLLARLSSPKP